MNPLYNAEKINFHGQTYGCLHVWMHRRYRQDFHSAREAAEALYTLLCILNEIPLFASELQDNPKR